MDRASRRIVGQRDALGALGSWESRLTPDLNAVCHSGGLSLYRGVVFGALHRMGGTQQIERQGATLRLSLPLLVRKRLSFCRKQANLETLVWLFIHRDNA